MTWMLSNALLDLYANSHCSPALEAEFSAANSSAGNASAPSNGSPTPRVFWFNDKTTASSPLFPSGMTSRRLTAALGEDVLTWFLAVSPVRISAQPAREPALAVRAQDYGVRWRALSAKWSRDMCSWKTPPSLTDEGWTSCLGTLPRWGLMRDGELWERVMLARRTNETESGFLPTPVKYDTHGTWESNNYHGLGWSAKNNPTRLDERSKSARAKWSTPTKTQPKMPQETLLARMGDGKRAGNTSVPLVEQLQRLGHIAAPEAKAPQRRKVYATPIRSDATVSKGRNVLQMVEDGDAYDQLARQVRREEMQARGDWIAPRRTPTPTAKNGLRNSGKGGPTDGSEHYPGMWQSPGHPEYGELNPDWVEWIMGWPIGWTSLDPMDPARFDQWWAFMSALPETGFGFWWVEDPSELPDTDIPKTIKPKDSEDNVKRVERIACLGNGQVSAVIPAQLLIVTTMELPKEYY